MPIVTTTTTVADAAGGIKTTTTTQSGPAAPAAASTAAAASTPAEAEQAAGPTRYVLEPSEPCPRWPKGATDVVTIPQAFKSCVANNGGKTALMFKTSKEAAEWSAVTWQQYSDTVTATGKAMMAAGLEAADAVNILAFNSPEWFYACIAAINIGSLGSGIYTSNNADGVKYVAAHSKCKIMFVDNAVQLAKVQSIRGELPNLKLVVLWPDNLTADTVPAAAAADGVVSWDDFLASGTSVTDAAYEARTAACDPAKACFLSYTSGTTGNPKAVMHSHDTILHASRSVWARINATLPEGQGMTADERTLSYLPMSHVAGSMNMFAQMILDDFKDVIYFAFPDALKGSLGASLKDVKPTLFIGVPRVWEKFHAALAPALGPGGPLHGKPVQYAQGALGLGAMKMGIVGAAPVSRETMDFFDQIGKPIYEIYGMTENFALSHTNVYGERKIGAVGRVTPGGESKLDADGGTDEICTRSRSTMLGYMYNKEKTEDAIDADLWLHTGDVGRIDDEGFYFIIGRIKELIITAGGENCAPVLLESAIKKQLGNTISNVMMIGDKRKFISAVITLVCKPNADGSFTDILDGGSAKVDPACTTIADAQASAVWKAHVDAKIAEANKEAISAAQQTKKWILLSGDFSVPGGELTPTLKLKRPIVEKKYSAEIEGIYA